MKTMKFAVKQASLGCGRTGNITDIPRLPNVSFETPALMLYTKGASIPHLTHEVMQMLSSEAQILQLPLLTTLHMEAGVEAQGEGLVKFSGLPEHVSFLGLQDPLAEIPQLKLEKYHMPLWTRMGKKEVDADKYMDIVETFKPDMYAPLCDGCTNESSSKKRVVKSLVRTEAMFSRCLERHRNSEYLSKNSSIMGVIEGGYSPEERKRSLAQLLDNVEHIGGFVLDGIENNGPLLEDRSFESITTIVESITNLLPPDRLRVAPGCWNAVTVLDLVTAGWDLLDSSAACLASDRGTAFAFRFAAENTPEDSYEIDLHETQYAEDFRPIFEGCSCLCCKKYSRAYVHHLLNTRELLSSVLLMIHNLHHYLEFFKCIRQHVGTDGLTRMRNNIATQYDLHRAKKIGKQAEPRIVVEKQRRRRLSEEN